MDDVAKNGVALLSHVQRNLRGLSGSVLETQSVEGLWLSAGGSLVFAMQAGFAVLEAGMVRSKNAKSVLVKSILNCQVVALCWYLVGWRIALGSFSDSHSDDGEWLPTSHNFSQVYLHWALLAVIAAAASGGLAERTPALAHCLFSSALAIFIYPCAVRATWKDDGWFSTSLKPTFVDFAGSTIVHSIGGVAALIGAFFVGPRQGRFSSFNHKPLPIPAHNHVLASVGTLLLWLGWYGCHALFAQSLSDSTPGVLGRIFVTTTLSAGSAGLTSYMVSLRLSQDGDIVPLLNGTRAGLVAASAGCHCIPPWASLIIGVVAALCYIGASTLLLKFLVDDPLDVFAVHAVCGAWGTLAIGLFAKYGVHSGGAQLGIQLLGISLIWAWAAISSLLTYLLIDRAFLPVRSLYEAEIQGLDVAHHGGKAYPDFAEAGDQDFAPSQRAEVAIVHTDLQGSTELWNWNSGIMYASQGVHDAVLRKVLDDFGGYEISTEGDAFVIAFKNVEDAVRFCFTTQHELMHAEWPEEVLERPEGRIESQRRRRDSIGSFGSQESIKFGGQASMDSCASMTPRKKGIRAWMRHLSAESDQSADPSSPKKVEPGTLFRGLRVRMGVDLGFASQEIDEVTKRQRYQGDVIDTSKALVDCVKSGGQIVLSGYAYQRLVRTASALDGGYVVVDLGVHLLEKIEGAKQIFSVLPFNLRHRSTMFQAIKTKSKISPAYFEAPQSWAFDIDGMPLDEEDAKRRWNEIFLSTSGPGKSPTKAPSSNASRAVTMVFVYLKKHKAVRKKLPEIKALLRKQLRKYSGYECQEDAGSFMLAFASPMKAADFSVSAQLKSSSRFEELARQEKGGGKRRGSKDGGNSPPRRGSFGELPGLSRRGSKASLMGGDGEPQARPRRNSFGNKDGPSAPSSRRNSFSNAPKEEGQDMLLPRARSSGNLSSKAKNSPSNSNGVVAPFKLGNPIGPDRHLKPIPSASLEEANGAVEQLRRMSDSSENARPQRNTSPPESLPCAVSDPDSEKGKFHSVVTTSAQELTSASEKPTNGNWTTHQLDYAYQQVKNIKDKAVGQDLSSRDHGLLRIGIHRERASQVRPHTTTGRADYFGPVVNHAARIAASAQLGQILLSEITLDEIEVEAIPPFKPREHCVSHGEVKFKGFQDSSNIYRLNWSDERWRMENDLDDELQSVITSGGGSRVNSLASLQEYLTDLDLTNP